MAKLSSSMSPLADSAHKAWCLRKEAIYAVLVLALLSSLWCGYGALIDRAEHPPIAQPIRPQLHYYAFAGYRREAHMWVELGKGGRLVKPLGVKGDRGMREIVPQAPSEFGDYFLKWPRMGLRIELSGFSQGDAKRLRTGFVDWHASSSDGGKITARFPASAKKDSPLRPKRLSLFLVDNEPGIRTVRIRSDGREIIASRFREGKWISFPISQGEVRLGRKEVLLTPLTGGAVLVSAVVIE